VDGEVVVERRRQWSPEHKAALLAEVEAGGGQVSVVARRHGVSTSLLAIGMEGRSDGGTAHRLKPPLAASQPRTGDGFRAIQRP
jgi:transposase-like protein